MSVVHHTDPCSMGGMDGIKKVYSELEIDKLDAPIITRFPPEPSGHIHLGHVKAICLDFLIHQEHPNNRYKEDHHPNCILRLDDTNPLTEKQEYVDSIIEDVEWLGFSPSRITYTSDYFDQLLDFARTLIRQGDAYVCSLGGDQIREYRSKKIPSPDRDRPADDNLNLFERMVAGEFENDEFTLRMKGDLEDAESCMWDLIFYRIIKGTPHYRTGTKHNVYPSYDFSHCIIDSLEGITHSCCTTEFITRRKSYHWLLTKLNLAHPVIYEFARLEVEGMVTSKRKLKEMIDVTGELSGWDDFRAATVKGLRSRGLTPELIRKIAMSQGYTKANSVIPAHTFEAHIRDYFNDECERRFGVTNPLQLSIITEEKEAETVYSLPNYPNRKGKDAESFREIKLTKDVFIDRSDFVLHADKKCYALAKEGHYGGFGRLRYGDYIQYQDHHHREVAEKNMDGEKIQDIDLVRVRIHSEIPKDVVDSILGGNPKRVKGCYHWVSSDGDHCVFKFLDGTLKHGIVEKGLLQNTVYQLERVGYFKRSDEGGDVILTEVVSLRSSYK